MKNLLLALTLVIGGQVFAQQQLKAVEAGIKAIETIGSTTSKSTEAIAAAKNLQETIGMSPSTFNSLSKAKKTELLKGLDTASLKNINYYGSVLKSEAVNAEGAESAVAVLKTKGNKVNTSFERNPLKVKLPGKSAEVVNHQVFVNAKNMEVIENAAPEVQAVLRENMEVIAETESFLQSKYGQNADGSSIALNDDAAVLCDKMSDPVAIRVKTDGESNALKALKSETLPSNVDDGIRVLAKKEVNGLQESFEVNLNTKLNTKEAAGRLEKAYDPNGACKFGTKKLHSAVKALATAA